MDVSPVRSSKTDFSIERILSAESSSEGQETPSWLCCTRYRPPRLPRAVSSTVCRSRRSGRHARVPFTATQAAALEAAYARAPYLAPPALRALAAALQLREDRIKIWFQNRRARERREKCTTIAPPRGVALPATRLPALNTWSHSSNEIPNYSPQDMTNAQINIIDVEATPELSEDSRCSEDRSDSPLDVETVDE